QAAAQFLDDAALLRLVTVQRQAEISESTFIQAPFHYLQGRGLLTDEHDRWTGGQECGNGVGDGLALAGARGTVEDEAGPAGGGHHGGVLAAVGVEDVKRVLRPGL